VERPFQRLLPVTDSSNGASMLKGRSLFNNLGQVVGSIYGLSSRSVAFVWEDGAMIQLPEFQSATAINDRTQLLVAQDFDSLFWDGQQLINLDAAAGANAPVRPMAVGPSGTVVGSSHGGAFMYTNGRYSLLRAKVDGRPATQGVAVDVNVNDEVVGMSANLTFWGASSRNYDVHERVFAWNLCSASCCP